MFDIPVSEQIAIAREIFPDIEEIGSGSGICQATCPGIACHTTGNGARDFRIWFEQGKGPHDNCVHKSCAANAPPPPPSPAATTPTAPPTPPRPPSARRPLIRTMKPRPPLPLRSAPCW